MTTTSTTRLALGALGGLFSLACGGLGGGGSAEAQALCDFLAEEKEHPCVVIPVGTTVTVDGIAMTVDKVELWEGKSTAPEIPNFEERDQMKAAGNKALALEVTYENTTPAKQSVRFATYLHDGNGEKQFLQAFNSKLYTNGREGWIDLWYDNHLGPGKSRKGGLVFPLPEGAVDGAKLVLRRDEKRPDPKDPRGRIKTFTEELYVVDLGPPT